MIKEKIFKQISEEMKKNGSWQEVAYLQCVSENTLTYQIKNNDIVTEINIISDDTFFYNENPIELFSKKRIQYLSHCIYLKNGNKLEKIAEKYYRPLSELGEN